MALQLEDNRIQQASCVLHQQLPDSSSVYFPLREVLKGNLEGRVWVDQWPGFKAIVITPAQWSDEGGPDPFNRVYAYCADGADLKCLCEDPRIFEPNVIEISFWVVSVDIWTGLKEHFLQGPNPVYPGYSVFEDYPLNYHATNINYNGTLPDGFTTRELTESDSELLGRYWFPFPKVENYVSECIRVTGISVCVMNQKKEPVAWSLRHIYGAIGFTFVQPEYRRLGLGKYVTTIVGKKITEKDGFCIASIDEKNDNSIKLHESLGFRKISTDIFGILSRTGSTITKIKSL